MFFSNLVNISGIIVLTCLTSCTNSSDKKPSVLIVLLEGLGFNSIDCNELSSVEHPIFRQYMCEKAESYTHFYANSTMVQSNIASLLSGQTPDVHKVFNNGSNSLAKSTITLPEKAASLNYSTAFFSDSPAVIKKSGLDQGVERFESITEFNAQDILTESFPNFLKKYQNWRAENSSKATFAISYISDLANPLLTSNLPVKSSENSNSERLTKNLEILFSKYIKNTKIYIIGTSGTTNFEGRTYFFNDNLFNENTHLAAFIFGGNKFSTNNQLTTFADFHSKIEESWAADIEVPKHESIDQFGSWRSWVGLKETLRGIRKKNMFVLKDNEVLEQIYDSYEGQDEVNPNTDVRFNDRDHSFLNPFYQAHNFAKRVFKVDQVESLKTKDLIMAVEMFGENEFILPWVFEHLAEKGEWSEISKLKKMEKYSLITKSYVSESEFVNNKIDACEKYFEPQKKLVRFLKNCNDLELFQVIRWTRGEEALFAEVRRAYASYVYKRNLKKLNAIFKFNWDMPESLNLELSLVDKFLLRKENINFRKRIFKNISQRPLIQD